MTFANPDWFTRRKYGGWGLGIKSWKCALYILIILAPLIIFQSLPYWSNTTRLVVTGIWLVFLTIDVISIMSKLKKDEREIIHEAIAERNALWGMMAVLIIGIGYQIAKASLTQSFYDIDWFLVAALFIGIIIKAISNLYLDRHN